MEEKEEIVEEKTTDKLIKTIKRINIKNNISKFLIILIALVILILVIISITRKNTKIEIKVRSTLEKVVEKSDLETVSIVYNVIAKKCLDDNTCDKNSNDTNQFSYVVSCRGTIVAGIDFKDVKVDVKNKKITIEIPEATMKNDPSIESAKFLDGDSLSATELPEAIKLCQETIIERSTADDKLIPFAKEQARFVLEEFYQEWVKAYDKSYVVEVK